MPETKSRKKVESKENDLKSKLKQKLKEKRLERTSRFVRDKKMDVIEDKLETSRNPEERKKLKEELAILEKIQDKEDAFAGEFPEYGDGSSYGGGFNSSD